MSLLEKLLLGYRKYFHNDVLNSDGRKIFEEALRMLLHEHPEYRRLIYRARRNPDLDHVIKITSLIVGEERAYKLLNIGINGVYEYHDLT